MKLKEIKKISAKLKILSGLHIGAGNDEIKIGGIDTPVVKNPLTNEPYIPGSSLKGKIRTLLEWRLGTITDGNPTTVTNSNVENDDYYKIAKSFGNGKTIKDNDIAKKVGPTRVSFFDCYLTNADELRQKNAMTEEKTEVSIDRFKGTVGGGGPRHIERVPAGAEFEFNLTYMIFDENDEKNFNYLALGMKLLEMTALGGSGSRGYGKVEFSDIVGIDEEFLENKKLKDISYIEQKLGINK
jgi:CRISPR-associated protein Csm3